MPRTHVVFALLSLVAAVWLVPAGPVHATGVSDWAKGGYSRIRLINAGKVEDGVWRAGLEIDVEDGWKTYWRSPGEVGVPPQFDWTASNGVDSIEVGFPVPARFLDSGLESIGYKGDVILPITIRGADPDTPPTLDLALFYAVCADICVPEDGAVAIDLAMPTAPRTRLSVEAALTKVPERSDTAYVRTATASDVPGAPLQIHVSDADGNPPVDLFVEAPQEWFLLTPRKRDAAGDGESLYEVGLTGLPKDTSPLGLQLRLTIVFPDIAVEETVTVTAR